VGSRLEWCFFEDVFFLVAVEEPAEVVLDCGYANTGTNIARKTAAIARDSIVRFIRDGSLSYYRPIESRHKAQRRSERVSDNERNWLAAP